jgi:hypothetical protein
MLGTSLRPALKGQAKDQRPLEAAFNGLLSSGDYPSEAERSTVGMGFEFRKAPKCHEANNFFGALKI